MVERAVHGAYRPAVASQKIAGECQMLTSPLGEKNHSWREPIPPRRSPRPGARMRRRSSGCCSLCFVHYHYYYSSYYYSSYYY